MRDGRIYQWAFGSPWAIEYQKGQVLLAVLRAHALGIERATAHGAREEREAREAARAGSPQPPPNIGVLPLHGVMMPRGNFLEDGSGSVSLEGARAIFGAMLASPGIDGIVLDIDSPGGSVFGVEEFASEIRASSKPVVAQAWDMAASAAYWIGSAAGEFVMTPSGMVGSIGVYTVHTDASGWYEAQGLKNTIIQAGKYKTELADTGPLTEEAQTYEQGIVDTYYTKFVQAVAKGRHLGVDVVRGEFGEGRVLTSGDALKKSMVDRIGTFEETVQRLARQISQKKNAAAASDDLRRRRGRMEMETL